MDVNPTPMIVVLYNPIICSLVGSLSPELDNDLDKLLSFQVEGRIFSNKYLAGTWDGCQHYYNRRKKAFSSGLFYKVIAYFYEKKIDFEVRNFDDIDRLPKHGNYELRDYQAVALNTMFQFKRGIVKSPPRSGKTLIAGAFLDQSRLFPAIFLCNSIDIANQTLNVFKKIIPDCDFGLIGDNKFVIGDITIMTVQSAVMAYEIEYKNRRAANRREKGKPYKRIGSQNLMTNDQRLLVRELFSKTQTVIYDECHHSDASIAVHILKKIVNAKIVFGLSATPGYGTDSDLAIEASIGQVIYSIPYTKLIEGGWLLPPKIYFYKLPKANCSSNVYPTIYKEAVVHNDFLNTLIAKLTNQLNASGKTVLIIVDKKTHGNNISALLPNAVKLYGEDNLERRNEVKKQLNAGELKCVISTLWDEGVDIPGLNFVINASGGMSPVDIFQRLRSITPDNNNPKKTYGGLIDFDHKEKFLGKHSKFRRRLYLTEPSFEIITRDVHTWDIKKLKESFK